jgi:RimJ/RimL family protein N-acetyltransferase
MPVLPEQLSLESSRVSLRDWVPADAPALESACGDREITDFTSVPTEYSVGACEGWIERQSEKRASGDVLSLAVIIPGHELPVGTVNLVWVQGGDRVPSLGYWLLPEVRGESLAAEAARLLADWGFQNLDLDAIELAIHPNNYASASVATGIGAKSDGTSLIRRDSSGVDQRLERFELRPPG